MRLVLFDVDGTLISTRGAGMKAFYRALKHIFDIDVNEEVIRPDGKTDPLILKELLAYFNLDDQLQPETQNHLFSSYLAFLEEGVTLEFEVADRCIHLLFLLLSFVPGRVLKE